MYTVVFIIGFIVGCIAYSEAIAKELRRRRTIQSLLYRLARLGLISVKHKDYLVKQIRYVVK